MVVYGVVVPILPMIVKERLGGSSSDVGLLFACYGRSSPKYMINKDQGEQAIGLLASTPIFAILSDKYQNRRIPMMVGMLGLAVATIGFSLASNYWVLIAARIGQGSAGGASWTIGLGMLADVYPPDNLGVVMGAAMMANAIGFMIGPIVGAYLYEYHGYAAPFIFCAALAVLDFMCILFITEPEKKMLTSAGSDGEVSVGMTVNTGSGETRLNEQDVNDLISDPKHAQEIIDDGLRRDYPHIKSDRSSGYGRLEPILPLYLEDLLSATPTQTGLVLVAAIFPTLLSSLIGYYADRVGHFYVSLVGMVIFAIATFSLSLPRSFLSFILPLALFGLGSSTILTPLLPAIADVVNKKGWNCYAKTYALYNMTYSLSMAAGPILSGFIFEKFGFSWTMIMFGVVIVVAIPVIFSSQIATALAKWRGYQKLHNAV
ncbi:hypothetical protein BGZ65_001228 [Modicella reniformis]|uniref:Major facilitator superfamily (MFS) profile domain-containing protein n=1 Tax=Modicella reniformis TaxID=1440133 RepID=A0A9P6ILQ4_9FUNG|nr:hypothetical protein BGZ65_001228 [Modicella reniformis]